MFERKSQAIHFNHFFGASVWRSANAVFTVVLFRRLWFFIIACEFRAPPTASCIAIENLCVFY